MKNNNFFLLLIAFLFLVRIDARNIECESEINLSWEPTKEVFKTCQFLNGSFIIKDNEVEVSRILKRGELYESSARIISYADDSMKGLTFSKNKRIYYLPIRVAESFPSLLAYDAEETSIKEISRKNFEGLEKLKILYLSNNKIETIISDTFEDLRNLEILWMHENYLTLISPESFQKLSKLHEVRLSNNVCISKKFAGLSVNTAVQAIVRKDCSQQSQISVACGVIKNKLHEKINQNLKTCSITSKIIRDNVMISNVDSSITALSIIKNDDVFYLPVDVARSFKNLLTYTASELPLSEISKNNFAGLTYLKEINLDTNRIENVPVDAFEDLINLEILTLSSNSLKFISSQTFGNLNKLNSVIFLENICIDKGFSGSLVKTSVQGALKGTCDNVGRYENVCESIRHENVKTKTYRMCNMKKATKIFEDDTRLGTFDSSITSLIFFGNKRIVYLPVNVHENFPNMVLYLAGEASVREVSYKNFRGLNKMEHLELSGNFIEVIQPDTFQDLLLLQHLWIERNFIKFINDDAFQNLNKLIEVNLEDNVCMTEKITGQTVKTGVQRRVRLMCSARF